MSIRPRLKIISFDAFNTIFTPRKPILDQYIEIGQTYGITTSKEQLSIQLSKSFKRINNEYPNYGKDKGLQYTNWWEIFIRDLYKPLKISNEFINQLIENFASKKGYASYPDVESFLQRNSSKDDLKFVISSNGDPRVLDVLQSLDLLKYFQKSYISYHLQCQKPERQFFQYIKDDVRTNLNKAISQSGCTSYEDLPLYEFWHVGDEIINDFEGSFKAGWKSILVDRTGELSKVYSTGESLVGDHVEDDATNQRISAYLGSTSDTKQEFVKLDEDRYITNGFDNLEKILGI